MSLYARVNDAFAKSGSKTSASLTAGLREDAARAGWPAAETKMLKVTFGDGIFTAVCVGTAEDWEYGTQDRAPIPVVRNFNNESAHDADAAMATQMSRELSDLL